MPSIRIGLSTDFNLTNELVGIGTTVPSVRLDVRGQILSENTAGGTGVSTLTRYDGFLDAQQRVTSNISIAQTTKGNLNSLSGEIILDSEITVTDGTPLTGGRLDSLTVTGAFDLPNGGTASRETTPEKGSTRFNSDLGQLEFYTGTEWRTTFSYDGSGRGRAVVGGGYNAPSTLSGIEFFNMSSQGNTQDFGTLTVARFQHGSCSSETRGLWCGGSPATNVIDYITIASQGNAIDFGDSTLSLVQRHGGLSSSTRGIFNSGLQSSPTTVTSNVIEYVQISTIGNAIDFGDLSTARFDVGTCSSPTRGIFAGGFNENTTTNRSKIDFITISSTGNSIDFGDLISLRRGLSGCSNSTRGIFSGGSSPDPVNIIDYITISSLGNALDFGDLTQVKSAVKSTSSQTRGFFIGGNNPGSLNTIEFTNILSAGNAQDFGDLSIPGQQRASLSDSHGGLGGF